MASGVPGTLILFGTLLEWAAVAAPLAEAAAIATARANRMMFRRIFVCMFLLFGRPADAAGTPLQRRSNRALVAVEPLCDSPRVTGATSFGILGPLQVVAAGREHSIRSLKQRALLAALLLARGNVVSVAALVDALWGPAPPASADHLIQVYVSELRAQLRGLGLDERLA